METSYFAISKFWQKFPKNLAKLVNLKLKNQNVPKLSQFFCQNKNKLFLKSYLKNQKKCKKFEKKEKWKTHKTKATHFDDLSIVNSTPPKTQGVSSECHYAFPQILFSLDAMFLFFSILRNIIFTYTNYFLWYKRPLISSQILEKN